jgi:Putative peptidoglycan binding domain/CHAP domain
MLARERALRIGLAEARAGVVEKRENFSKRIKKYQAADSFRPARDTGYAWCNSFVVWCYQEAGRELTETGRSAGVQLTAQLAKKADLVVRKPERGDIVCFQLPPVDPTLDHIGLVLEVLSDGSIRTLEGNTPGDSRELDGVFVKVRPREYCDKFIRIPGQVPEGIGRGDHGGEVRDLQKQLVEVGHKKLEVDGDFGEKTERAVEQFQRRHELPETGVADSKTRAAIAKALEPAKPEPKPEPVPTPRAKPRPAFVVTAAFQRGAPKEVSGLTTRAALNRQVSTFLNEGARFVQISPEAATRGGRS